MGAFFVVMAMVIVQGRSRQVPAPRQWLQYGHNAHHHQSFKTRQRYYDRWTYSLGGKLGAISAPVAAVGEVVYAGTNANKVVAIEHGRTRWVTTLANQIMTTPVIVKNEVIVGVGNKTFKNSKVRGTGWSGVVALSAATGKVVWRAPTQGEVMPTPAIVHNRVYAATGAGHVVVIALRSGKILNRISLAGSYVSMSSPLVLNNSLFVGAASPYALYALSLPKNKILWRYRVPATGGLDDCSPVWADGVVAVQYTRFIGKASSGSPPMQVEMVGISPSGHLGWKTDLGIGTTVLDEMQTGQPVTENGIIYVGSPVTKAVYAIAEKSGRVIWRTTLGAAVRGVPAIYRGNLLVGDSQGNIDTLSLRKGRVIKRTSLTRAIPPTSSSPTPPGFGGSGPVIVGSTLYIASTNGVVYARPIQQFLKARLAKR